MKPVNLLPGERRLAGGDPKVAYGVVGGLALLLVMVMLAITTSNKATTIQDETAALQAETQQLQAQAQPVESFNDFADEVSKRTLLIGGLANSRFPWNVALRHLSDAMPEDVTLDKIAAATATAGAAGAPAAQPGVAANPDAPPADAASLDLEGCTSGWVGLSRYIVRLRKMPGVQDVTTTTTDESNTGDGGGDEDNDRKANCGPTPVRFALKVYYQPLKIDLIGLPKVGAAAAAGATGATGATPAPGAPTATPTAPAPAPAAFGGGN